HSYSARWTGTNSASPNFFFSSRRRHTRWPRDWSSDVCSSDLLMAPQVAVKRGPDVVQFVEQGNELVIEVLVEEPRQAKRHHVKRSEERRVGKEWRCRW